MRTVQLLHHVYAAMQLYACTAVHVRVQLHSYYTGLCINFSPLLKIIAIFGQKMFTSTEFRSKFVETYYLKFVKLEVARILGYIYTCVPLVPLIKYQYSTQS
jgi:hypothetical protein